MKILSRAAVSGAFAVAPLMLLAGCGSSGNASSNDPLTPVQATSYAELPPATSTTTTTLAPDTALEPGSVSPNEQTHTIVANDNLSKLSRLYNVPIEAICNYNEWPDCIEPLHLLLPGDIVRIPPNAAVPGQTADTGDGDVSADPADTGDTETTEPPADGGCTYVVVVNDNPSKVANKFDITFDELQNANTGIDMLESFPVGYELTIPANGTC